MACDEGRDMHELIDRLRQSSCGFRSEAADAIERLIAEVESLKAERDRLEKENFWLSKGSTAE